MAYLRTGFMVCIYGGNEIGMHGIGVEESSRLLWVTDGLAYGSKRVLVRYFILIVSIGFPPKSSTHNDRYCELDSCQI